MYSYRKFIFTHSEGRIMTKNFIKSAIAYANSNAASKVFVSRTAQNTALDQAGFESVDWVLVGGVGSRGEMGRITNIINYDTWDDTVIQKAKGLTDAGTVDLEVARDANDEGQAILLAAAAVGNNDRYAFKEERSDGAGGTVGTVIYNRGLITGPRRPGGRNEDFDLEIYSLGFDQEELVINPLSSGNAPQVTVLPAITGLAQSGETLTVDDGTFTGDATITYEYQWFAGGVAISGATTASYTLTANEVGKIVTARVVATNASGTAFAFSDATATVS